MALDANCVEIPEKGPGHTPGPIEYVRRMYTGRCRVEATYRGEVLCLEAERAVRARQVAAAVMAVMTQMRMLIWLTRSPRMRTPW